MKKLTALFIIGVLMLVILGGCGASSNTSNQNIFKYKGSYIGNNSADGNIIKMLPYGKVFKELSLQTQKKPYGMAIKYGKVTGNIEKNAVNNATYLFALVKNADSITFNFPNESYTLTRQQLQKWYGKDLNKVTNEKDLKHIIQTHLNNTNKLNELVKK